MGQTWSSADRWKRWTHQQPLLFLGIAAVLGVLIDDRWGDRWGERLLLGWMGLGLLALLVLLFRLLGKSTRHDRLTAPLAIMVLVMSVAGINHRWQDRRYESAPILSIMDTEPQAAIVEGTLSSLPVLRPHPLAQRRLQKKESPWQTSVQLKVDQYREGQSMRPTEGVLLVSINGRADHWQPGDRVRVYGTLRSRNQASNPGVLDWSAVDRRRNIHGRIDVDRLDQFVLIRSGTGKKQWHRGIAFLARRGREILLEQLGPSTGPLAVALVIGQRDFVAPETRDDLLITGTAHLLSVSGMHLAIVVAMTAYLATLLRFPIAARVTLTIAVCVFYTALTGGRPPVMRAAILVSTLMIAIWMRRPSHPLNLLSLAGLLLTFFNPELVFSVGVQLSFLAVATLMMTSGRPAHRFSTAIASTSAGARNVEIALETERRLNQLAESSRSRPVFYLRRGIKATASLLWLSFCVTAISAPLVWHQFHVMSFISVVTNVLLGPLLLVALGGGIATVIGGLIHPLLAWPGSMAAHGAITLMRAVITGAADVPGGHVWLPAPATGMVLAFYAGLAITLVLTPCVRTRSFRIAWIVLWMIAAHAWATRPASLPDQWIEATFVDVGHGTCVVLRSQEETWLYDCGRLGNEQGSSRGIDQVLWSLGVTHLNGIILSHADADHFNALPGILRRFTVDQIITPPGMMGEPETALRPLIAAIHDLAIPVHELSAGDVMGEAPHAMVAMHPPQMRIGDSDNANSLVIRWVHAGRWILLPGDLEPPGTAELIHQDRPPPGGVLMAPHHGSLAMDAEAVLQWARPAVTIVSGGRLALRPEVESMLAQRGSDVHVTARGGAIRVRISDEGEIEVKTWRQSSW